MQQWEYRMFNVDDSRVMETLARNGVEGWEAYHHENYCGVRGGDATRIYCKRLIEPRQVSEDELHKADLQERDAILDLYMNALGMRS